VKIELGAQSDTAPAEKSEVSPFLAQALPALLPSAGFRERAVLPPRTF
jgi:hypothetical protein